MVPERINSPPLTSRKRWGFIKLHYMSCIASHSSVIHLAYHETWKELNYHYNYICPNICLREFQVPPHPFFAQIWTVVYALIYEFLYWFLPRLICTSFHLINSIPLFIFSIHLPTSHIYRFHTLQVKFTSIYSSPISLNFCFKYTNLEIKWKVSIIEYSC